MESNRKRGANGDVHTSSGFEREAGAEGAVARSTCVASRSALTPRDYGAGSNAGSQA
jgi:hypothetical protein